MPIPHKILHIEDEAKLASFVKRALDEAGFTSEVADDGEVGYRMARSGDYALLIVDQLLPSMTGLEICKHLRGEGHAVPILMLTARNTQEDTVAGLDAGADDYLTKPFGLEELLARVRALLRRHDNRPYDFQVEDLTINVMTREVRRGKRVIVLSAREFALLEFLMRHAGRPVNRAEIAEHVWGLNFDPETNIVDVYINYLRSKIENPKTKKLIQTVRGIGYTIG